MELRERWNTLKTENPGLRARDGAARLGVTEAQLAESLGTPLQRQWTALFHGLKEVGEVMVLTRNEMAVHERTGSFVQVNLEEGAPVGGVYGPDIDLRLFPTTWGSLFAVDVPSRRGVLSSIQLFGIDGQAVHKIYATEGTDRPAWEALIERLTDPSPQPIEIKPLPAPPPPREVEPEALLQGWAAMTDTHDFFHLLRRLGVTRHRAVQLAEGRFTRRVDPGALHTVLKAAANDGLPIMVFVGNHGCIQIHSGPVHRIKPTGDWLNVLDPRFNLHIRQEKIHEVWDVRKPTTEGDVSSLEIYDAEGELRIQLFGVRKRQEPEDPRWRALLDSCAPAIP